VAGARYYKPDVSVLVPVSLFFAILVVAGGTWIMRRSSNPPLRSAEPPASDSAEPPRSAMGQLKQLVERGEWQRALPSFLVIAGLAGLMVFGALALIFVFDEKAAGYPMLAVAIFAIARLVLDYYRS
jgi:hypothetical protein